MIKAIYVLFVLSTFSFSQMLDIKKGWNLLGATENITLNNAKFICVNSIFIYRNNNWIAFHTNQNNEIISINQGEGFWVYSYDACEENTTNNIDFAIIPNTDIGFANYSFKVEVFGIPLYATYNVSYTKLLHIANITAQYLDNDEDGVVDSQILIDKMLEVKAFMVIRKNLESDVLDFTTPGSYHGQDLADDETIPLWHTNGHQGRFDASLEEIWHMITVAGYANVYPDIFGENTSTSLTKAMDIARGGHFLSVPNTYPNNAWYSYDDTTCEYSCQASEYIYWAMSSILGAQANRLNEIGHEWKLNTKAKVQNTDTAIYDLLTNEKYKFPTKLPNGMYRKFSN